MSHNKLSVGIMAGLFAIQTGAQATQAPAPQQHVDAWVVTAHIKVRMLNPGATDSTGPIGSAVLHFARSGPTSRIAFAQNPNAGAWEMPQFIPIGTVFLLTPTDTVAPVTVLDSAQKTFTKMGTQDGFFPRFNVNGRHPSPDDPVTQMRDVSVTVDSIGIGPTILGHPTIHYRQTQHATLQTDAGPMMTMIMKTASVIDLDIATDIPNAPTITAIGLQHVLEIPLGFVLTPQLTAATQTAEAKYPHGVILHMDSHQITGTPMGTMTRLAIVDVDHWERSPVDAALFTVPATYTATPGFGRGLP
ncbi:MAG TPA: hypothetical protein VNU46_06035 [Gemmatimonadaceae bacterium]|jgi:hypothetical protein|nr:hypothetical protein [Gemmatimonadaceae bacterium]